MPEASGAVSRPGTFWKALERLLLTAGAQSAIQILGFLSGLIVLRWLPIREYAYYTIANAALGTMTVLSDSGISRSVMAQGGKVWQSRSALGGVIAGGLVLRRRFAIAAISLSIPILYSMLKRQGASSITAILVAAGIVPLFVSSLTGQLLQIPPKLQQRLMPLQSILLRAAGIRLVLVAAAAGLFPVAWLVSLCAGLAQTWTNRHVRSLAKDMVDMSVPPDPRAWAAIVSQVRRSAPGAVYYALEGQISIWLISIFGKTLAIAQVGALSRLAMAFNIVGAVIYLLWEPQFARMPGGGKVLRRFWSMQLALCALLGAIVAGVSMFPSAALAVLGSSYSSLTHEVVLTAVLGALTLLSGCAYVMSAARAVVISPWFSVPIAILLQTSLILTLPISTVTGVLWLGILTNLVLWGMYAVNFTRIALKE